MACGAWFLATLLAARAGAATIDFENLQSTGPGTGGQTQITKQYASLGVNFNSCVLLDYSRNLAIAGFAHSGTRAIEQCYGVEFCTTPISASFDAPQSRVKVWVGYSAASTANQVVVLRAFDAAGSRVAEDRASLGPSTSPTAIRRALEITRPAADIRRVEVAFDPGNTNGLAVDDLEFGAAATGGTTGSDLWARGGVIENAGAGDQLVLRVGNLGPQQASMPIVAVTFDGKSVAPVFPGPLASGSNIEIRVPVPATLGQGKHSFTSEISGLGVSDPQSGNNRTSGEFTLAAKAPPTHALPDLAVLDGRVGAGAAGRTLTVTLANVGTAVAPAALLRVSSPAWGEITVPTPTLAGGSKTAVSVPLPAGLAPRTWQVSARVQPAAGSRDASAGNDAWSGRFTVEPPATTGVKVPALVGFTLASARVRLARAGLVLGVVDSGARLVASGIVTSQNPGKGARAAAGSAVEVALVYLVPDVRGASEGAARARLEAAGFRPEQTGGGSFLSPIVDRVDSQEPGPDGWAPPGSSVGYHLRPSVPWLPAGAAAVCAVATLALPRTRHFRKWTVRRRTSFRPVVDAGRPRLESVEAGHHVIGWRGSIGDVRPRLTLEEPPRRPGH